MTSRRLDRSVFVGVVAVLVGAVGFARASTVSAGDGVRARHVSSLFWRRVTQPNAARAAALLTSANDWLDVAAELPSGDWTTLCTTLDGSSARLVRERFVKRAVASENALARLELAREITPDDPHVVYALARAMSLWERPERGCAVTRRDADALELWRTVRALDPSFEPEAVSEGLALGYTRVGELGAAITEYQSLVELTTHVPRRALLAQGNLAELLMMTGELRASVAHYEAAVRLARAVDDPSTLALFEFGLAAALDRLGEHTQALTEARNAVDRSDDSLRMLRGDGVFFAPAYEVHFYEALGQESRADGTRAPLAAVHARASRAESLAASVEHALTSPLSRTELAELGAALAAWLSASAAAPTPQSLAAEVSLGRALDSTLERVLVTAELRLGRERAARAAAPLRTIDDHLEAGPSLEAHARLRVACLAAAARSWRRYLDEGGRDGSYAEHARSHLAQLAEFVAVQSVERSARASHRTPSRAH